MKELWNTIKNDLTSSFKGSHIDNAFQKDKKELKAKETMVRKALKDINPIIHPGLVALQELIKNNDSSSIKGILTVSKPSLLPILNNHRFLTSFPKEIQLKLNPYLSFHTSSN